MYRILRQRGNMSILPFMAECVSFRGIGDKGRMTRVFVAEPRDTRTSQVLAGLAGARRVFRRAP